MEKGNFQRELICQHFQPALLTKELKWLQRKEKEKRQRERRKFWGRDVDAASWRMWHCASQCKGQEQGTGGGTNSEADQPSPPLSSKVPWTAPLLPLLAQPQLRVVIFSNLFTSLQAPWTYSASPLSCWCSEKTFIVGRDGQIDPPLSVLS